MYTCIREREGERWREIEGGREGEREGGREDIRREMTGWN